MKTLITVSILAAGIFAAGFTTGRSTAIDDNYGEIYAKALDEAYNQIERGNQ